ncbi:MAG: sel1 repeat family protein [Thiotrichales bacterium]|nr:sel1 repeat family protein [Thiotrichales bacterium]MBT7005812.1 sel1 repeat family protein [Thiotrichales bacterium]
MKLLRLPLLLLLLLLSTTGMADFDLGLSAVSKGDYPTALREFKKAADQRNAGAQYNLGSMYAKGYGVAEDYVEAYKWSNLAAALGNKRAAELKKVIATLMTRAQIAEAQKLSTKWFKEHNR